MPCISGRFRASAIGWQHLKTQRKRGIECTIKIWTVRAPLKPMTLKVVQANIFHYYRFLFTDLQTWTERHRRGKTDNKCVYLWIWTMTIYNGLNANFVFFYRQTGKLELYRSGQYFHRRYSKILGDQYSPDKIYVLSTDKDRAIMRFFSLAWESIYLVFICFNLRFNVWNQRSGKFGGFFCAKGPRSLESRWTWTNVAAGL